MPGTRDDTAESPFSLTVDHLVLLSQLLSQEARELPVLSTDTRDPEDWFPEFMADQNKLKSFTASVVAAGKTDLETFGPYARASVRNWLIDQARKTDQGALRRQIESALQREAAFEQVPSGAPGAGQWRLTGRTGTTWAGNPAELVEAAAAVSVHPKRGGANRRGSLGSRQEVAALLTAILDGAGGSLPIAQICHVVGQRIPGTLSPQEVSLDADGCTADRDTALADRTFNPEDIYVASETDVEDGLTALEIFTQLSGWERQMLPVGSDLYAIAAVLHCGRSTANTRRQQLRDHLLEMNGGVALSPGVMRELLELCS